MRAQHAAQTVAAAVFAALLCGAAAAQPSSACQDGQPQKHSAAAHKAGSDHNQKENVTDSKAECPTTHEAHTQDVHTHSPANSQTINERGARGMGFSQTATSHHFLINTGGGVIQVEVNDPANIVERDNIRKHLAHIAQSFANGDFEIPMFVHDTVPPGVPEMKRLRDKIRFTYEQTEAGGRVAIGTSSPEALSAVHKFLRFQIEEHGTSDPANVPQK